MGFERELKLQGRLEDLRGLLSDPSIAGFMQGRPKRKRLAATYYDTEDGVLRSVHGMSLRVRREGRRLVQTVKRESDGHGLLMARGEWEMQLDREAPDPTRLTDPALTDLVTTLATRELVPISRTDIRRETVDLDWTDEQGRHAVVNLALDDGKIDAEGASGDVAELELELVEGDPACLFSLALHMADLAPIRFGTQGKWERGFRLAAGLSPEPLKAIEPHLSSRMNIEEVMIASFEASLRQWLGNEAAIRETDNPHAIHQMRIALRRLRSLLTLFKQLIPDAQGQSLSAELRTIVHALGEARNLDVFKADLLAKVQEARPSDLAPQALQPLLEQARSQAYDHAKRMIADRSYGRTLLRLAAWLELRGWRVGVDAPDAGRLAKAPRAAAAAMLDKALRKVKHRGRGFAGLPAPRRHEVRIALKKLRYGAEAFRDLFKSDEVKAYGKRLSHLQDLMGRYNDAALTGEIVRGLLADPSSSAAERHAAAMAGGLVVGWHAHAVRADEAELLDAWKAFRHARPFWRKHK